MSGRLYGGTELARLYGVELTYTGMDGEERRADPEALALTLKALGAQIDDNGGGARDAIRARRAELDRLPIQPVHVAWDGRLPSIHVRMADGESELASVRIELEDGDVVTHDCRAEPARVRPRGGWQPTHLLRLGRRLPHGYHRMQVETSGATWQSLIISAPLKAHAPIDAREWGMFMPLYAVHTRDGWGTGSYTDLERAAQWVGSMGGSFVSTLPLLATFLDAPFDPSPYSPASRLFWNELFIDVTRAPGWGADGGTPLEDLHEARAGEHVDYRRVASIKRRELERALAAAPSETGEAIRQFAASSARADDYARFRAVCDRRREGWPVWPERLRDDDIRDGDYAPEDYRYHLFVQWLADQQLGSVAAAHANGAAALYLDMPLGVNPDSYDAWRFPDLFAKNVSAGAPPDPLFTGGQDWGFRPLRPDALRTSGYSYLIETLRHHFRHAKMLRLDHVMSLYRLYWVPGGVGAKRGVYVRYPEDELFAVLVLESARHQAAVIGEDLGTVPAAVRKAMDRHGVHRMQVVQFEASPDSQPPVSMPDEPVVASLNTHDMPPFAGFWKGVEIDDQLDLGLIDGDGHAAGMARRAALRHALGRELGGGGDIDMGIARQRLLERLAASPARYILVTLEDLWGEDRPQNVPGTSGDQRPNWRRRMRHSLEEIIADRSLHRMLRAVDGKRQAEPTTSGRP